MSWLTTCDDTNKVVLASEDLADGPFGYLTGTVGISGIADLKQAYRRRTSQSYEYVGVDQATAETFCGANPSTITRDDDNGKTTTFKARMMRDGSGGAYKVVVETEVVYDLFRPVAPP